MSLFIPSTWYLSGEYHCFSLWMTRKEMFQQITVGFALATLERGSAEQAEQLRKLAAALDRISHVELTGVHVMLGSDYGVDLQGRLWLDAQDTALFWSGCAYILSSKIDFGC